MQAATSLSGAIRRNDVEQDHTDTVGIAEAKGALAPRLGLGPFDDRKATLARQSEPAVDVVYLDEHADALRGHISRARSRSEALHHTAAGLED